MHELKKRLYRESKNFISKKLYELHSKPFLRTKTSFARAFLRCPQKIPFFTSQKPFFCRKLYELSSKAAFLRTKSLLFAQNLSELPPKASLFHPPPPIRTTLNLLSAKNAHFHKPKVFLLHKSFLNCYPKQSFSALHLPFAPPLILFAKNAAVLLLFALILCCKAGASHRFKSLPAIPGKLPFSALPVT